MKVIGFSINKINAERKAHVKGKLEIKQGINIDDIKKEEVSISKSPAVSFEFTYSLEYSPGFGKIEIKGTLVALDENNESKEILKEWKKKKFAESGIKLSLFNFIMAKCNLKALQLEEEIGFPLHIPMPKLAADTSSSNKSPNNNPANYAG